MSDDIKAFFHAQWAEIAPAWLRWAESFRQQTRAATDLVLELAQIETGARVLDLASGTGEPALEIATHVGTKGRVTATDIVPGALQLCAAEAQRRGFSQLCTADAEMESLPFAADSFDAVSCRLGVMFCRDIDRALSETRRVLRASGSATFIVWGDSKQPLFECTLGELGRSPSLPAESADGPGPFRFSKPGRLAAAMERAGFREVREASRVVSWPWPGSAAQMWTAFIDLAGPSFAAEIAGVARERPDVHDRIVARLQRYERAGCVDPKAQLIGVCGRA